LSNDDDIIMPIAIEEMANHNKKNLGYKIWKCKNLNAAREWPNALKYLEHKNGEKV
jgi:hypothetical protein